MNDSIALVDGFNRPIKYLRLSVTDRCDFRCTYCMAEDMQFLPKKDVLSLEELYDVAKAFVSLGVEKIRLTGGEPLIRNGVMSLIHKLGHMPNLRELCLTTNGSRLAATAEDLKKAGLNRINVSLDTLDPARFRALTRYGKLDEVLKGLENIQKAGFERVKINSVLLKHYNFDEAESLARFALERGFDISFIEEMPLGSISSHQRDAEFVSSETVRQSLAPHFSLIESSVSTGGPARYWDVENYPGRIGFISPHSENFCSSCNRVRVTASGKLLLCLGNEHSVDLRKIVRESPSSERHERLKIAIIEAMQLKPEKHHFDLHEEPQIVRFMNATGG